MKIFGFPYSGRVKRIAILVMGICCWELSANASSGPPGLIDPFSSPRETMRSMSPSPLWKRKQLVICQTQNLSPGQTELSRLKLLARFFGKDFLLKTHPSCKREIKLIALKINKTSRSKTIDPSLLLLGTGESTNTIFAISHQNIESESAKSLKLVYGYLVDSGLLAQTGSP